MRYIELSRDSVAAQVLYFGAGDSNESDEAVRSIGENFRSCSRGERCYRYFTLSAVQITSAVYKLYIVRSSKSRGILALPLITWKSTFSETFGLFTKLREKPFSDFWRYEVNHTSERTLGTRLAFLLPRGFLVVHALSSTVFKMADLVS